MSNHAELYRDKAGEWRWKLKAANGRIIADSGEGYLHQSDALDALALVTAEPPVITKIEEGADHA